MTEGWYVLICPACDFEHLFTTVQSFNDVTEDVTYYSDGDMELESYEDAFQRIAVCRECNAIFKFDKKTKRNEYANRPSVASLRIGDFKRAIDEGLINGEEVGSKEWKDDMIYLRLELWRRENKSLFFLSTLTKGFTSHLRGRKYKDNCQKLLDLLEDSHTDQDYWIRAELHRNIDEFDECIQLLNQIHQTDRYEDYIQAISVACTKHNSLTLRVGDEELGE